MHIWDPKLLAIKGGCFIEVSSNLGLTVLIIFWLDVKIMFHMISVVFFQAQLIAQSIGQAFQVAYMEFLKANGIEDPGLMKEIDYQEVLNQQQIYGEELTMFSNKENQKEVGWYVAAAVFA